MATPSQAPTCPLHQGRAFDPFDAVEPRLWLRQARREAPIFYEPKMDVWCVTRHADVMDVLREPQFFSSSPANAFRPLSPLLKTVYPEGHPGEHSMLMKDPPDHTRVRKLANRALTPVTTARFEPRIRERAEYLVESFAAAGQCDLIPQFADILPMQVIIDFIGAPDDRLHDFQVWAGDHFALLKGAPPLSPEEELRLVDRNRKMMEWLRSFVESRRANPVDDVVSALVHAASDDGEPTLSTEEVIAVVNGMIVAGTETSAILLPLMIFELLRHPEALDELLADPGLAGNVVEETLRLWSPVHGVRRLLTRAATVGGIDLPAGVQLFLMYGSACHDEEVFQDPESFNLHRKNVSKHLAFGKFVHMCIGAPLARLEARVALQTLVGRLPNLRLADEQSDLGWTRNAVTPKPVSLRVAWDSSAALSAA